MKINIGDLSWNEMLALIDQSLFLQVKWQTGNAIVEVNPDGAYLVIT